MKHLRSKFWILALVASFAIGLVCATERQASFPERDSVEMRSVTGKIRGTQVDLVHAEYDGTLSIFQGEGWGHNPSLLLFMFFGDDEIPAGRTIEIALGDEAEHDTPHVHYRWQNDSGEIQAEAVVHHYRMRLTFGDVDGDVLPGTIEFSVPGEETRVKGAFRANVIREEASKKAPHRSNRSRSALQSSRTQRP